jgi:HEAT repeat protein
VKVELLEWQEGRGYLLKTRVTVAVMDDSRRPTAAPGDPAAAFARLRRMNVQVSDGLLCVEQQGEATDAEIVDVVRAMLAVCSDPGRASLEAIFQSGETEARADALRFLVAVRGYSACADALSMALDSRVEDVQLVAVAAIAKANDVAFLDRLLALAPGAPARLAASIAETIGRLGDPRGEPALLRLLSHQAEPVRLAAIRALGRLGTIHAVGPLLPLANGLLAVSVKGAARDAIASIQARLGDADAGRLSLLAEGPAEGGVSIASDEGALSLTPGDRKKE